MSRDEAFSVYGENGKVIFSGTWGEFIDSYKSLTMANKILVKEYMTMIKDQK